MNLTQTLRGRQHYQKKLCADGFCSQLTDGNEGHFPVNSTSLLFFLFPLLLLSRFSWPLCTHAHVSAWLWRVNNSVLGKDPLWNAGLPFYLNDESGKLPRWNIYYTKCILLKRKLTRDTPGNYMYLQYVDPGFFSCCCETSVSDLAKIFDLWLVIWNQTFEFQICAFLFI